MRSVRKKIANYNNPDAGLPAAQYLPRIQDSLLLQNWLCCQLGFLTPADLRGKLRSNEFRGREDGFSDGYHFIANTAGSKIPDDKLKQYDQNIRTHLRAINAARSPLWNITYFQYLALLFSEIFLDRWTSGRALLTKELNAFVDRMNSELQPGQRWKYSRYLNSDLTKIAFWSATGSGKTLLMHLHLLQVRHYRKGSPEAERYPGVMLITPNEGLSRQHLREFDLSGIEACSYSRNSNQNNDSLVVIEITKLKEGGRSGGQTVDVKEFADFGLIFVDEGHRGASGEAWRGLRAAVGENALTIEYSATFGQIVNGASVALKPSLWNEYSRTILFDYSYPHFFEDGYGKDYKILNVDDDTGDSNHWVLLGGLLAFYEQSLAWELYHEEFRQWNIEKPLWVFVGNSVTGKTDDDKTDMTEVVGFLQDFISQPEIWTDRIACIFTGQTGLRSGDADIYSTSFRFLRKNNFAPTKLYADVLRLVMRSSAGESLRAIELKNASGEIAIQAGASEKPFAVINIGDAPGLIKLLSANGIICEKESLSGSLFDQISKPDSSINLLIGSRKFMEGWDSFRVSSLGLMNIGRGEGSQIVQLFGRGVRLRGKNYCLKRSYKTIYNDIPADIRLLETLQIYGVRATYITQFRKFLKDEGVETNIVEVTVPIQVQDELLKHDLITLNLDDKFPGNLMLTRDDRISVTLDLRPKVETADSAKNSLSAAKAETPDYRSSMQRHSALLNWQKIYLAMEEFRRSRERYDICFTEETLKDIIARGNYNVYCIDSWLDISAGMEVLKRYEEIVLGVLQKYFTAWYDRRRRTWEMDHQRIVRVDKTDDPNLDLKEYVIKIAADNTELIEQIRNIASTETLYNSQLDKSLNLHFDHHLYLPLLVSSANYEGITPAGLEPSERKFLSDLRGWMEKNNSLLNGKELFLLRNQSRKGVNLGSDDGEGFYPDFLLWILDGKKQYLTFIEPHGIRNEQKIDAGKFQRWKSLKNELEPMLRSKYPDEDFRLDLYIISNNTYAYHRKDWVSDFDEESLLSEAHLIFPEYSNESGDIDYKYIDILLSSILQSSITNSSRVPAA